MPKLKISKFLAAEDAGRAFGSIICSELDKKKTLEEAVRTAYRTHGVIDPSFFTRFLGLGNDPYLEAMFGSMGLYMDDKYHDEITDKWWNPFGRLRRIMGEVSKEMYER